MVSHRPHTRDIGCEIRAAHLHLDRAKALGDVVFSDLFHFGDIVRVIGIMRFQLRNRHVYR